MSALAGFNFADPVGSVDSLIESFVASKYPAESTDPVLASKINAAIAADVALGAYLLEKYAMGKAIASAENVVGPILDSIAAKVPVLAPEIAAIKAKIVAALPNA